MITEAANAWQKVSRRKMKDLSPRHTVQLKQRNILIMPSAQGYFFLLLLFIMLLTAINYQNNMIFAMVFLLVSLFAVSILHASANLVGLEIQAVRGNPTFAGEMAEFDLLLVRNGKADYHDIQFTWPGQPSVVSSLVMGHEQPVKVFYRSEKRGILVPQVLKVESVYPLGLIRAWTWIKLDLKAMIYPMPIECEWRSGRGIDEDLQDTVAFDGSDDFHGFKTYKLGDSLRHVSWKSYARGLPLLTKQFSEYRSEQLWVDWSDFGGVNTEERLSRMTHWVLQYDRNGDNFGLRFPGLEITTANGSEHRERVLTTLAVYGEPM